MKKTLVALAALAVVGVASAQSSITISGALDISIGKLSNGEWGVNNGMNYASNPAAQTEGGTFYNGFDKNVQASFIAFKGTEDLGGGLKAGFNLTTVAQDLSHGATSITFSRESFVSLSSAGLGTLQVGRQTAPIASLGGPYDLTFGNLSGYLGNAGGAFYTSSRRSNQIQFISDPVAGGLVIRAGLQMQGDQNEDVTFATGGGTAYTATSTADGTATTVSSYNNVLTLGGNYSAGPLSVGFGLETPRSNSKAIRNGIVAGASYDFGVAKVAAMYAQNPHIGGKTVNAIGVAADQTGKTLFNAPTTGQRYGAGYTLSASVPLGATTLAAAYSNNTEQEVTGYELIARYNLSSRTFLYLSHFQVTGSIATAAVPAAAAGTLGVSAVPKDPASTNIGVRHTF